MLGGILSPCLVFEPKIGKVCCALVAVFQYVRDPDSTEEVRTVTDLVDVVGLAKIVVDQ